jgi:hypothetical protein
MTPLLLALQIPIPGAQAGIMEIAVGFALVILIALSGWQTRTLRHAEGELGKIKQLLLGYDGKGENGSLLGQMKTLRTEMRSVQQRHEQEDALRTRGTVVTPSYVGPDRREAARREGDEPPSFDEGRET